MSCVWHHFLQVLLLEVIPLLSLYKCSFLDKVTQLLFYPPFKIRIRESESQLLCLCSYCRHIGWCRYQTLVDTRNMHVTPTHFCSLKWCQKNTLFFTMVVKNLHHIGWCRYQTLVDTRNMHVTPTNFCLLKWCQKNTLFFTMVVKNLHHI